MVYNAARLRDGGQPFLTEAAMCKIFSSEVAERVTSLAVNLFGGYGFVKDYPVEKLYRDSKIGKIYEGTSFMQLQTIANRDFLMNVFPTLGENRREALKIAAGFRGEEAFEAGVGEDQAFDTVLPWLSEARCIELAKECLELYCWDRLGVEN